MKAFFSIRKITTVAFATLFAIGLGSCTKDDDGPAADPATVTDVDGNVYTTIRIGTQLWTVENLRTTKYNDGSAIATGLDDAGWRATTTGAYAIYNDNNANNTIYGKLYNWHAVNTAKLAPTGWHVPTNEEWQTLVDYLGGSSLAGGRMKSTSSLWASPNLGADNSSKFTALPSGYRGQGGNYALLEEAAYWWSTTAANATQGRYMRVTNDLAGSASNGATNTFGYAVRCIKN